MRQGKIVDEDGTICYYKDDLLHRDNDLPAIELVNGDKVWFQNGLIHRDADLPAVEHTSGTKFWYQNGKSYRLNGPSDIYADGNKNYYIDGKNLTPEQHANHPEVKKYKLQQILDRMLKELV